MSKQRTRRFYSGFKKSKWWSEKRKRLYFERKGVCEGCGKRFPLEALELHHIVPRSEGGRDVDAIEDRVEIENIKSGYINYNINE